MRRIIILGAAMLMLLGACNKVQPIYNVERTEIFTGSGDEVDLKRLQSAIANAVTSKTWRVKQIAAGHMEARFIKGKKEAVVDIKYTKKFYTITYKDSTYLLNKGNLIHRRYNAWVRGLQKVINRNLGRL
jgi:hypothetical protein